MLRKILFTSALIIAPVLVHACMNPDNVVVIWFTNEESVDLSIVEKLGEEGISYFKEELISGTLQYTYRSHYNNSTMVNLTKNAIDFTIDTSNVDLEGFQFGALTRTELDWLVETGILSLDRIVREKIELAFTNCGKGSFNFYTKQDTLVHSSNALGEDGKFWPIDCIGSEITINLPPEVLIIPTGIKKNLNRTSLSNIQNSNKSFFVDINGRKLKNITNMNQPVSSSIFIQYDASSGKTIKRTISIHK